MPHTAQAFLDFIHHHASHTKQLYLLGDVFEAWAGDDDIDEPFNRHIVDALRSLKDSGVTLFWMAGNRDFLAGQRFADVTGAILLPDPFVATIAGQAITLTHGDAYCTDDESYMQFRAKVRSHEWRENFLAMSLAQRKAIIESLRAGSREAQRDKPYEITDVNHDAIARLLDTTATSVIIHGHTHRPARHEHQVNGSRYIRYVLSDWDLDHGAPRGDWLAIDATGAIRRFGLDRNELRSPN